MIKPNEIPHTEFKIRNTGQSPAYRVAYIAGFDMLPIPLPAGMGHLGATAADQDTPQLSIAASEFTLGEANGLEILPDDDFQKLLAGTHLLYVFVRVFYRDVFHDAHETSFCGHLNFELANSNEQTEKRRWKVDMIVDNKRSYST